MREIDEGDGTGRVVRRDEWGRGKQGGKGVECWIGKCWS